MDHLLKRFPTADQVAVQKNTYLTKKGKSRLKVKSYVD